MKHDLSQEEVVDFKTQYCNENASIATLLRERFLRWIEPPILDVGCGIGDISRTAFPDVEAVLLDKLDFSKFPVAKHHERLLLDFYAYGLPEIAPPRTALFIHVLQYIDADPARLLHKTRQLNMPKLITVLNRNDGMMNELLAWGHANIPEGNPELHVPGFPPEPEYVEEEACSFTATLTCPTFDVLAKQVSYLFNTALTAEQHDALAQFLTARLNDPRLPITQDIKGYRRIT